MECKKFEFPYRKFYIVIDKVSETDFFLEKMKQFSGFDDFKFYFSAFVSAARSITFCIQSVMSKYPNFDKWYPNRQQKLKDSKLCRFFVDIRNHSQKVGDIPIFQMGKFKNSTLDHIAYFIPSLDFPEVPNDDIVSISQKYFCEILFIVFELYRDYSAYVDPRAIFSLNGLSRLNWTIEDLEEALGFPRGWTDVSFEGADESEQRLAALRREGGDEEMEHYFIKYNIGKGKNE